MVGPGGAGKKTCSGGDGGNGKGDEDTNGGTEVEVEVRLLSIEAVAAAEIKRGECLVIVESAAIEVGRLGKSRGSGPVGTEEPLLRTDCDNKNGEWFAESLLLLRLRS